MAKEVVHDIAIVGKRSHDPDRRRHRVDGCIGEDAPVRGDRYNPYRISVTADKDQPWQSVLHVEVTDPFQVNEILGWDDYLIRIDGGGSIGENPDGWRKMNVSCYYSYPDQSCSFTPYLEASAFNIQTEGWGRYLIYPTAYITVDWQ